MFEKKKLLRISKQDGKFVIDFKNRIQSRGAYLCKSLCCLEKAKKRHGFEHSFKNKSAIAIYEIIKDEVFI